MFRPKRSVRVKLFEMSNDGSPKSDITSYLKTLTIDHYEAVITGRGQLNVLGDAEYRIHAGDFDKLIFPNPDNDDQEQLGVRCHGIDSEVSCTFAQALRDVISDLRGYRNNPLLALLRGSESSIRIEDAQSITSAVASLNQQISALAEVKSVAAGVQKTLHETVGHTYAPAVSVESALPDTLERLVQRLVVKVGDSQSSGYRGDLLEQSLGGANLIYLALKLLEFELKSSGERVAHFLLIEEPEAHIHTHIQKTLFDKQSSLKTQVIVSTHSTHISSASRIRSVNILARVGDHAEVYQPANGLDDTQVQRMERYLDAVRSTLLFAKGVVLVEGDAELVMIPALLHCVFGIKPDELGVSIISMGSAWFDHLAAVFHDDRVQRHCAIATDADAPLFGLPANPDDDNASQRSARRAQATGAGRKRNLEGLAASNKWVKPFFAEYTFEADFVIEGNASAVERVIPAIYSSGATIELAANELRGKDVKVAALRTLAMARTIGKGWFAVILAEQLDVNAVIPDYLLRATAFAAGRMPPDVVKRMALHRIAGGGLQAKDDSGELEKERFEGLAPEAAREAYARAAPYDILSRFLTYSGEYHSA
jgi:predicted ATPase